MGWRDYFVGKPLRALIDQALEHNRDLRNAVLRVEEARTLYGIQRADSFPTIHASADMIRARMPEDLSITGDPGTASQYQVSLNSVAWEIDLWGRLRNLKDAALERYLASEATSRAVRISLIAAVADSYLKLRELDERIALIRQTISTREESFRIFRRRFEVGSTSRLDLTQVEALLMQARLLGAELEQTRAIELHSLALLVGSIHQLPAMRDTFNDEAVVHPLRVGLPSDLLISRPDIMAAEHRLRAANANIGAARAAFFPRVTLVGALGTASADLKGLFGPGSVAWNYGPNISVPIFDAGRNRSSLNLTKVRRELSVVEYERTIQTAFREVSDGLSSQEWLTEQVRLHKMTVSVQAERARLAQLRYDSGAAAFLEVLDAQRELLSAEQQLVQARRALLSSRVRRYAALGGGAQSAPVEESAPNAHVP
jgi:multidrug efflux system outer membrane protein